jgi:hypothetical protein
MKIPATKINAIVPIKARLLMTMGSNCINFLPTKGVYFISG